MSTTATKKKMKKNNCKQPKDRIAEARQVMADIEKPQIAAHELLMELAHSNRTPDQREKQFLCEAMDCKPWRVRHHIERAQQRISTMRAAGTQREYERAQHESEKRKNARDKYEAETVQPLRDQLAKAENRLQKLEDDADNAALQLDQMERARNTLRKPAELPKPMKAQAERLLDDFEANGPPAELRQIDARLEVLSPALALPNPSEIEHQSTERRRIEAYFAKLPTNHPWYRRDAFVDGAQNDGYGTFVVERNLPADNEWQKHVAELRREHDELIARREQVEREEREQREELSKSLNFWVDRIEEFVSDPEAHARDE